MTPASTDAEFLAPAMSNTALLYQNVSAFLASISSEVDVSNVELEPSMISLLLFAEFLVQPTSNTTFPSQDVSVYLDTT